MYGDFIPRYWAAFSAELLSTTRQRGPDSLHEEDRIRRSESRSGASVAWWCSGTKELSTCRTLGQSDVVPCVERQICLYNSRARVRLSANDSCSLRSFGVMLRHSPLSMGLSGVGRRGAMADGASLSLLLLPSTCSA